MKETQWITHHNNTIGSINLPTGLSHSTICGRIVACLKFGILELYMAFQTLCLIDFLSSTFFFREIHLKKTSTPPSCSFLTLLNQCILSSIKHKDTVTANLIWF